MVDIWRWNFQFIFCCCENCHIWVYINIEAETKWPFFRKYFVNSFFVCILLNITAFWWNSQHSHWQGDKNAHVIFNLIFLYGIVVFWLCKFIMRLRQNDHHFSDDIFQLLFIVWMLLYFYGKSTLWPWKMDAILQMSVCCGCYNYWLFPFCRWWL